MKVALQQFSPRAVARAAATANPVSRARANQSPAANRHKVRRRAANGLEFGSLPPARGLPQRAQGRSRMPPEALRASARSLGPDVARGDAVPGGCSM